MSIALTFIITLSCCLTITTIIFARIKSKSMQLQGRFDQINQELSQIRNEKELQNNEYSKKIDFLQKQVFEFETKNQLLQQERSILEKEKKDWQQEKELILHKLSEELIKKSYEQQAKLGASQEENIKKITQDLFKNFENVTSKVVSLNDQIQKSSSLMELTQQALLNPSSSGRTSEITLENILKNSGLKEKQNFNDVGDYILQSHFSNYNYSSNEGKRPDAILFFPNDQIMIIDSKSSSNFLDLQQAKDSKDSKLEREIAGKIKESFRKHLESLKRKDYAKSLFENLLNKKSSDYKIMIVMFIQTEKMLNTIREIDPELEQKAIENGIIIVSPVGLFNLLSQARIVIDRIKQEKNIEILKIEVKKLLDNIAVIFKDSGELGKTLNKAMQYHEKISKNLNRSIFSSVEKISELGIESKKSVNIEKITEFSAENNEN